MTFAVSYFLFAVQKIDGSATYQVCKELVMMHISTSTAHTDVYSGTPLQWTPLGPKILSVIKRCPYLRGFQYISGRRGMRNQAVKHNVAAFSEFSFAVHWQ